MVRRKEKEPLKKNLINPQAVVKKTSTEEESTGVSEAETLGHDDVAEIEERSEAVCFLESLIDRTNLDLFAKENVTKLKYLCDRWKNDAEIKLLIEKALFSLCDAVIARGKAMMESYVPVTKLEIEEVEDYERPKKRRNRKSSQHIRTNSR